MFRIWVERAIPPSVVPLFEASAEVLGPSIATPDDPLSALPGAQAIIAGARIRYDGAFMDRVPTLRVISRTGIGVDNVVIPDATARGIAVCNTPDAPTVSTAEHTVTLMLSVAKQVKRMERALRTQQNTDFFSMYEGLEVHGLQLGLVGIGRIGGRVAVIAQTLGMRVTAYDPYVGPDRAAALGITPAASLDEVLQTSDVVSLHVPLTPDTRKMMNTGRFARMKPGAIFINAARGGLVDEAALLDALERGHLRGAGLDVFDPEPPAPDNPLLHRDDVTATPHVAGVTTAGKERMWRLALDNALKILCGERPDGILNPEVLERVSKDER